MNNSALRLFVRSIIAEAKEKKAKDEPKKSAKKDAKKPEPKKDTKKSESKKEEGGKKSSGKLVDLKKEVAYLKQMSEQLQEMGLNENTEITEVEFSNLQKFVNELAKVKQSSADLKKKLDEEITATEAKIQDEKNKIKEMMGLVPENIHNTAQMGGVTTSKGTAGYINNPDSKKGGDYDPKKRAANLARLKNIGKDNKKK
jgi:dGTP triphosphohydrolase